MNAYTPMLSADILTAIAERETRLAAIMREYDLKPVALPPFYAWTAREIAVALDKLERKCA